MQTVSRRVTATILSMSLLTVMAGAAIAPALGIIRQHFADAPQMLIQLIVSIPALMIILTNLLFLPISRRWRTRTIALTGLTLYVVAGAGCFLLDNIYALLALRAVLGVSVGLIMPLSTGLLAYYFPPEEQARLMGLSAAMNQLGGVVATLLAGVLATIEWRYAFLVYLLGLIAMMMVWRWLPDAELRSEKVTLVSTEQQYVKRGRAFEPRQLLKFHPSVIGMLLLMMIFFVFPTNFAITAQQEGLSVEVITLIMVGLDVVAFLVGLVFGGLMHAFRRPIKYFAPMLFLAGYASYVAGGTVWLIVGSCLIGMASIKGGRNSATTVMPLLSAALYLGQFVSPLVVSPVGRWLFGNADMTASYKVAILLCLVFLCQVWLTRHFQSLPPESKRNS